MSNSPPTGPDGSLPPNADYGGWPTLSDAELAVFPPTLRQKVEAAQHEVIVISMMALEDMLKNCHGKYQFAKTFRVLRRDKRDTLQKLRNDLNARYLFSAPVAARVAEVAGCRTSATSG